MFNYEKHSGKLLVFCIIFFILTISFFIAFLVETNKTPLDACTCTGENFIICDSPDCLESAKFINESIDTSINPCDDFYEYACGNWLRDNPLSDGQEQFGMMSSIGYKIYDKLKGLLEQPTTGKTTVPLDAADKAKVFYRSCVNEDLKSAEKEINGLLGKLGGWPLIMQNWKDDGNWKWWEAIATVKNSLGSDIIMSTIIQPHFLNKTKYSLYIVKAIPNQMQVGSGKSPHLSLNEEQKVDRESPYLKKIMNRVCQMNASFCNATRTWEEIEKMFLLESELQQGLDTTEQLQGVILGDTIFHSPNMLLANDDEIAKAFMKVKVLQERIPDVEWKKFIEMISNGSSISTTADMELFADTQGIGQIIQILKRYPSKTIANFIGWNVIRKLQPYTSGSFKKMKFNFNSRNYFSAVKSEQIINTACAMVTSTNMGYAVASLYASSFMVPDDIEHATNLVTAIKGGFLKTLNENTWLDKATKEQAINKLNKMKENIAFPPWTNNTDRVNENYRYLGDLSETEFLKNTMSAMKSNFLNLFSKLNGPFDSKNDWLAPGIIDPMTTNAFYATPYNSFYLVAGLMGFPLISKNSLASLNHGGIGYVIGHEIMHAFDSEGSHYDEMGRLRNWWTPEASARFAKRKMCMETQYSNKIEEITSKNVDGKLTLGENIADNGGIKGTYWGYKAVVKDDIRLKGLESISGDKLFFISAAQAWCTNTKKLKMEELLKTDTHAPAKLRVNVPFSNSVEFIETFKCSKNTKMNERNKCVIF